MYEVIKNINDTTKIAIKDNIVYILKRIYSDEMALYKKLIEINNPNIVKFFEMIVFDNQLFVVEEYIQGVTLQSYIEENGALDDESVKKISLAICNGLSQIHNLGIVHRDITPGNIMISNSGEIKIIDFGISRLEKNSQTKDTQILGTQGYAAPEQYGFSQTNNKADIYALGVLINYMKTLKLPNEQLTIGVYSEIVTKCTQIDENRRYQDIDSVSIAISRKNKIKGIVQTIPGFRKGKWWHIAIACVYYFLLILVLFVPLTEAKSVKDGICTFAFTFFALAVPVPILLNYKNWINKLSFIRNKPKAYKFTIQIIFTLISEFLSCVFILLD
jgi:serine/threonine protein kinase